MIRVSVLLVLLIMARANAETINAGFDPRLATDVYATALSFMAPRTLEPVAVSQLTLWGLRGLTAVDPDLRTDLRDGRLRLYAAQRMLTEIPAPPDETPASWAAAAGTLAALATTASPALRRAGTRGVIQSFFDELFNHLDPYSRYIPPAEAGEDRARRSGRGELGLTLVRRDPGIIVQSAITDGPASLVGIKPGDIILSVDGQSTRGQDAGTVLSLTLGAEGTSVSVSWQTRGGRVHTAEVIRSMVPPETVFASRSADVLLLRVSSFSTTTGTHISLAVRSAFAAKRPPVGIVLDLRGNRGGLLRQAVNAADIFLPSGIVAMTEGRDPEAVHILQSTAGELAEEIPVVILVDGRTASAAEILAAALADRGRGVVVGSTTLGKGLVQTIAPLPDGGELFVTWSRVLAPRGWPIQGLGLLPQVCTSLGTEALWRQLAALEEGQQSMAREVNVHRSVRTPLPPTDIVAIRNFCPAAEGHDTDVEVARTLIAHPAAYAAALLPPLVRVQ